ncbi:hypothetical protein ABFX02_07G029100 [Erythranthe guttata]
MGGYQSFGIIIPIFLTSFHILTLVSATHPLDPLTPFELTQVQILVKKSHKNVTFHYVGLDDPPKSEVQSWLSSQNRPSNFLNFPRRAFVIARTNSRSHVITIDLSKNSILNDKVYNGNGYPMLNNEEQTEASELPLKYAPFKASIAKRGLNISEVMCEAFTIGWYGEMNTKRVVAIMCYYIDGTVNFYMRPIDGVMATVDLDEMKIVDYRDRLIVPVPKGGGTDYRESKQNPPFDNGIKGVTILQSGGPSFTIVGNNVRWASWEFHLAFDMRVGPKISLASIYDHDKDKYRRVMYRGYISELFVPYQDLTEEWYFRTFLDAGEFGFGICAVPLQPSKDCPKNAVFLDGYYTTRDGTPAKTENVFCVFERYAGDIMWRHSETILPGDTVEVREDVTLVVRMVSTVANYDYIIDWEFKQTGSIKVTVSLSGILAVKASKYTHKDQTKDGEELYGNLVAENTIGTRHDHFVNFHLDLDIDGGANSFVKTNLKTKVVPNSDGIPPSSPRKSYWTVVNDVAKTESDAKIRVGSGETELTVVNPNKKTKMGNDIGYRLIPGPAVGPMLLEDDHEQIRGAFSNYNVWVTPYNNSEKWAGGLFVDQSHGDDNLAQWTLREIENKDIVLWYTLGFHHVPVQEDFPIMPTLSGAFELKPNNFFERNPVLKVNSLKPTNWVNCSAHK